MTYKMDRDKLEEITRIINREAQPTATEDEVWAYIAKRPWLRDASGEEIAAWIIRDIWGGADYY